MKNTIKYTFRVASDQGHLHFKRPCHQLMLRRESKSSHARIFSALSLASGCSFHQTIGGESRACERLACRWRELIDDIGTREAKVHHY